MNVMCVISNSGINADGFNVKIQDETETKTFEGQYRHGYNASYSKELANNEKPFVTDILVDLVNKNNVEKIIVTAGKYIFSGKSMTNADVDTFIKDYINPNSQLIELL